MNDKISHLNMIQEIINRMARNSFALKGWAVTLVTGLFALAAKETNTLYFLIAYIPIVTFWLLDAYYLKQERLFRSLYGYVCQIDNDDIDFKMDISKFKDDKNNSFSSCAISISEIFYLPLAISPIIVIIVSLLKK